MVDQHAPRPGPVELPLDPDGRRGDVHRLWTSVTSALSLTWCASRRGVLLAATLQLGGALAVAALVVVGQRLVQMLLDPAGVEPVRAVLTIAVLALAVSASSAAAGLQSQQQRLLGEEVATEAWRRVLDVTARIDLEHYESPRFYDRLERVRLNAMIQPVAMTTAVFGLLGSVLGTGGLLLVLLAIDPLLVPVLLLAGLPSVYLARRASVREFRFVSRVMAVFRAREYLREVLASRDAAKEVRAFGIESVLVAKHHDISGRFVAALRRHVRRRQAYVLGIVLCSTVALFASLGILFSFLSSGRVGVAEAAAAALGVRLLGSRLDQVFQSVAGLLESAVFLDDMAGFVALGATVDRDSPRGREQRLRESIVLDGVSYTYPGSDRPAVTGVDLTIGAGEVVAIVGENGSGKTTLAKIIAGLYRPTSGRMRWDRVDTAAMRPVDHRRGVSVIFQDFVRYSLSARENIGLGDPDHLDDLESARRAARQAGASGFLEELRDGYDTVLSKEFTGGVDLSVGQWQRVAFARALRKDAPLLILDEPSSALDPRAEQALFADVRATLRGRTALLISHRYSTVRAADRIYVMQDGRIRETGSHDSLMAEAGLYAELFTLQAKAYR